MQPRSAGEDRSWSLLPAPTSWVLAALMAVSWPARADVLVVDWASGGSGSTYGNIWQAIAAAQDGDTVVVRNGVYSSFEIRDKSLTVVADGRAVFVRGLGSFGIPHPAVRVVGLEAGKQVVVRGLRLDFGVSIDGCDGSVWIDTVQTTAGVGSCTVGNVPGLSVTDSARVTCTLSTFLGATGDPYTPIGSPAASPGAYLRSATVQLFDCLVQAGGDGSGWGFSSALQPGAAGMLLDGSVATVMGCAIIGGPGEVAPSAPCTTQAIGGPGVLFLGAASTLRSAASTAIGGALDLEPLCPGQTGPQGPAISGTGTILALPGFARHLRADSPVRTGEALTFEVEGIAGEIPLLLVSLAHDPVPLWNGVLLLELPPTDVFVLPPLPATGRASLALRVPSLPEGGGSLSLYAQAVFLDPTPAIWLGAGASVALLDSGF